MANLMLTMGKALLKHKLHLGTLTGIERFMVSSVTLADRPATFFGSHQRGAGPGRSQVRL